MTDFYQPSVPLHGWTCFHGDATFMTHEGAAEHFGSDERREPACKIKNGSEQNLVAALRRAEKELDEARFEREQAEWAEESASGAAGAFLSLVRGARSSHDLWCHLECLVGRVLAAESELAEIAKTHPELVTKAMEAVCGPGTYYLPVAPTPASLGVLSTYANAALERRAKH